MYFQGVKAAGCLGLTTLPPSCAVVMKSGNRNFKGIKIFSHLPTHIKRVANEIQVFKKTLNTFLLDNSFYCTDEYINSNK